MQDSSKFLLISLCCLFLAYSSYAQTAVTTTTTPSGTNVTTATNATSSNTTVSNPTNTSAPVITANNNATNTTAGLNETIITDSSQNGTSIVITTPINPTTNVSGTPTNTTITLQQLQGFETASPNISNYPTQGYTLYLVDIHFISANLTKQYIAYHYCHFVSEDLMQCALFNDSTPNARFIGNEYFITKALFDTLPDAERNLWHSHPFEVQSGLFVAPDLSPDDEFIVMEWLMGTFGKVADTWQYFNDFPFGPPQLGMALALDSQVDWNLADQMDQILNLNTTHQERRQQRAELIAPLPTPGADNYLTTGSATQYQVYQIMLLNNGKTFPTNTTS